VKRWASLGLLILAVGLAGLAGTVGGAVVAASEQTRPVAVHTVELDVAGLSWAPVSDGSVLVRKLARSPLWSVTWNRDGAVVASYRTVSQVAPPDTLISFDPGRAELSDWLGSWVAAGTPPPQSSEMVAAVGNGGLRRGGAIVSIEVTNQAPDPSLPVAALGADPGRVALPVLGMPYLGATALDGNTWSLLTVLLADGWWLRVREQGASTDRHETRAALVVALADLQRVAALPADTLARDAYADVFAALGGPTPHSLRYPGRQDRDTLGLVLQVADGLDYEGVTVRVFDEAVCDGECTRDTSQHAKAELLGEPPPGDLAFVLMEDCAVYLDAAGSRRYGTFSGSGPFEAEIRWLDREGRPIASERGPFRGWER
jgi:hypothetical protein